MFLPLGKLRKPLEILGLVGAVNWGLVAFGFDLVDTLLGSMPVVKTVALVGVGIGGLSLLMSKLGK